MKSHQIDNALREQGEVGESNAAAAEFSDIDVVPVNSLGQISESEAA